MRNRVALACCFALLVMIALPISALVQDAGAGAAESHAAYQHAPKVIREVLDAPPTPQLLISPTRDRALVVDSLRYPPISDLASPCCASPVCELIPRPTDGIIRRITLDSVF